MEELEALGIPQGRGRLRLMSATGIVEVSTYFANGELMGEEFSAILVPASTPLIRLRAARESPLEGQPFDRPTGKSV